MGSQAEKSTGHPGELPHMAPSHLVPARGTSYERAESSREAYIRCLRMGCRYIERGAALLPLRVRPDGGVGRAAEASRRPQHLG